jgi:TIR domain
MARRPRKTEPAYQVFLSHSHQDRWIAHVMREKIEGGGIKVWLDAFDLPGGANVHERIKDGVRASAECLILLSPASRQSDWVRHEAGLADGMDKWTTLVLLHVVAGDVPDPVRHLNYLSINDFESYVAQVVARGQTARRG